MIATDKNCSMYSVQKSSGGVLFLIYRICHGIGELIQIFGVL